MTDCTNTDIIRRVEKIEIDVAVLDSKSNRLHQDMKEALTMIHDMRRESGEQMERIRKENQDTQTIARKTNTLVLAIPAFLAAMYTLFQIIHAVKQ